MINETTSFHINTKLSPEDFNNHIDSFIAMCKNTPKSIPLPILIRPGAEFIGQLGLLLASVDCSTCDSICCKYGMDNQDKNIGLLKPEVDRFITQGINVIQDNEREFHMNYPCPFYDADKLEGGCSIYKDRPLSCTIFPFQDGCGIGEDCESALALNSQCPEGRRIAKKVYLFIYEFRHKLSGVDFNVEPE